ncbi:FAST kinase domain-containing protein 1, mitochondrial-like [Amphiura filiformis]|uniref:FAST kinase domain-containing protein 1, mitochondrial-like n=1 Tax=Amphiura filiformis TaxID=82378 RepID=UPI003B21EDC2
MASVLKHGAKRLATLPSNLPLHTIHPPSLCLQCLSLEALHTRSSVQLLSKTQRTYSQQKSQLPSLHYDRSNLHLNPLRRLGASTPAGIAVTTFDPLQTEIAMSTTVDGLFGAVSANRSLLELNHVCSIFKKLEAVVEVESCPDKQQQIVESVKHHPEFMNLCLIAQKKVMDMTSDELTDTMESMIRFVCGGSESSYPLVRGVPDALQRHMLNCKGSLAAFPLVSELFVEGSHRLHSFDLHQLAKYAMFVKCSHSELRFILQLGPIAEQLSQVLDDLDPSNLPELIALMTATIDVSTGDLQNRVLKKVTDLLHFAVQRKDVFLTGNDIVRILTYEWKAYRNGSYLELNDICYQRLLEIKEDMSLEDLHKANMILFDLDNFDRPIKFVNTLLEEMLKRLPSLRSAYEIGLALENISILSSTDSSVKFVIEDHIKELLNDYCDVPLRSICIALRRSKYIYSTPLVQKLAERIKLATLSTSDIVHVVEYFQLLPEPNALILQMYDVLLQRLCQIKKESLSAQLCVNVLYCISLLPQETIADVDLQLSMYEDLLPQLSDRYINLLSFALQRLKFKLKHVVEMQHTIQDLLEKVNFHAVCNIEQNKSVHHLNNLSKYILREGQGDVVFLDRVMKQYTEKLDQISHPRIAAKCANVLYKAGYLHVPLMNKIAEVITKNIHKVKPFDITSIIAPFCHLGYHDPPNADEFFDACINRVIPFLDEVERSNIPNAFYLVSLASYLSCVQRYPEVLLKRIFSVEFLDRFDAALQDAASDGKLYMVGEFRRRMMHLNRSVVLECPELQIPWFHEEHCYNMIQKRTARLSPTHLDLQSALVEVLGGAQYLRSLVVCPYFVEVMFEYVLDPDGNPLAIAEYGSALNFGRSNRVMSDLMQWGTQTKTLPKGSQRVAVDYMHPHFYNINSSSLLGGYILKRRQLEIMGFKYIQIPYYEWRSASLPGKEDKAEYLQKLLFSNQSALTGPITVLRDEIDPNQRKHQHQKDISQRAVVLPGYKSLGGVDLRVREEDMVDDPTLMRVLKSFTGSSEGQRYK